MYAIFKNPYLLRFSTQFFLKNQTIIRSFFHRKVEKKGGVLTAKRKQCGGRKCFFLGPKLVMHVNDFSFFRFFSGTGPIKKIALIFRGMVHRDEPFPLSAIFLGHREVFYPVICQSVRTLLAL